MTHYTHKFNPDAHLVRAIDEATDGHDDDLDDDDEETPLTRDQQRDIARADYE